MRRTGQVSAFAELFTRLGDGRVTVRLLSIPLGGNNLRLESYLHSCGCGQGMMPQDSREGREQVGELVTPFSKL